jgi:16S rRNA (adenine1518-N6/adenine1519-N6)-dimethyltransferase
MRQKLGQHFLINTRAIGVLLDALSLAPGDHIVEIGSGEGSLTIPLLERCESLNCQITAIEKDSALAHSLAKKLTSSCFSLEIGDVRDALPALSHGLVTYKLLGNIPYYLTGQLFRIVGELAHQPQVAVFTIQKEVAKRVSAREPRMNFLAASVQVWSKVSVLGTLLPRDFSPPPKVSSAMIQLIPYFTPLSDNLSAYYRFITIVFQQPRKMLLNNLSHGLNVPREDVLSILSSHSLTGRERPHDLSVALLTRLTTAFAHLL